MDRYEVMQLDFFEICMGGDFDHVNKLLRSGAIEVNYQHKINGWSALHWAACREHEDICVLLIDSGYKRDLVTAEGKTPFDVCPSSNAALREILRLEGSVDDMDVQVARSESDATVPFTPSYMKNPAFPYTKKTSFDKDPESPTKGVYFSYGLRDATAKTRFILVLTSASDGKEAYKRITVPGGSTLQNLKKSVENALRQGPIAELLILPDRVVLEDDSQIYSMANCQKIAVTFGSPATDSTQSSVSLDGSEDSDRDSGNMVTLPVDSKSVDVSEDTATLPIERESRMRNQAVDDINDQAQPAIQVPQPVQMNEVGNVNQHIAVPEQEADAFREMQPIVREYNWNLFVARLLNDVDNRRHARAAAERGPNYGWIDWVNENAGRQAMAVALGVSAGALLWKLAVMRK